MKILVAGGFGFVGSHVLKRLFAIQDDPDECAKGDLEILRQCEVRVMDIIEETILDDDDLKSKLAERVEFVYGDITVRQDVLNACKGCDMVLHLAALVDFGNNPPEKVMRVNVEGTRNLIEACKALNLDKFVMCSTMDVYNGRHEIMGGTEDTSPYGIDTDPDFISVYDRSKALAERLVIAENGSFTADNSTTLKTCAIQPMGLYGPGDPYHIHEVFTIAHKAGRMYLFRVGDGKSLFQHAYIVNTAHCFLTAMARMAEGDESIRGQTFLAVDNTDVCNFFDFFNPYLAYRGYQVPKIKIPKRVAMSAARLAGAYKATFSLCIPSMRNMTLSLTPQAVESLTTSVWFNTDKAERLLRYRPIITPMDARRQTFEYYSKPSMLKKYPPGPYNYGDKYNYFDSEESYLPHSSKL